MTTGKAVLFTVGLFFLALGLTSMTGFGSIMWLMILGTSIWAAVDSVKVGTKNYKTGISAGPAVVLIGCLLLWIVVFPWYLISKGKIERGEAVLKEGCKATDIQRPNQPFQQPIQQPDTATTFISGDVAGQLEKLASLKEKGILTDEEFQAQKSKLLLK